MPTNYFNKKKHIKNKINNKLIRFTTLQFSVNYREPLNFFVIFKSNKKKYLQNLLMIFQYQCWVSKKNRLVSSLIIFPQNFNHFFFFCNIEDNLF